MRRCTVRTSSRCRTTHGGSPAIPRSGQPKSGRRRDDLPRSHCPPNAHEGGEQTEHAESSRTRMGGHPVCPPGGAGRTSHGREERGRGPTGGGRAVVWVAGLGGRGGGGGPFLPPRRLHSSR